MIIRLLFSEEFNGQRVRVVGIYKEFSIDDGSGEIEVEFNTEKIPEEYSRVDLIGILENSLIKVDRRRYIDLEEEFYRRKKATELMISRFGKPREIVEKIAKEIAKELIESGGLSRDEIIEVMRENYGYKNTTLVSLAIEVAHARGEIIEIEPGFYVA